MNDFKMDDLTELLKRILEFGQSYKVSGLRQPLFRLTPYEYELLSNHLTKSYVYFSPEYFGDLPTYFDVNFELVGKPLLFDGRHIRSDSGIEADGLTEVNV